MPEIPTIEPFQFIRSTAFSERVQLANKLNEVIDALNQIGSIDDLQTQIDAINSEISEIQTAIGNTDTSLAELENRVNTLVSEVNGLLKEVVNEVVLDAPKYGQVRVKVIHEDDTETASNALQIPVIVDGGISLISGTTARSFKIRYITADGVTHTTNDFVIPEGGSGTDVTVTSVTILEGDTDNSFKFEVGLSDGSSIQSNSYPFPAASELTPATTSQLGGVKIGQNIKVTADGTISVDLSAYLTSEEASSDYLSKTDAATTYQPKGDYLTEIPIGGTKIGGVKNGGNVTIESDGTMNSQESAPVWVQINTPEELATKLANAKQGDVVIFKVMRDADTDRIADGYFTCVNNDTSTKKSVFYGSAYTYKSSESTVNDYGLVTSMEYYYDNDNLLFNSVRYNAPSPGLLSSTVTVGKLTTDNVTLVSPVYFVSN